MKAKQQEAPNNEAAEQQDGPNYGPPTEKEHWQAIKQAAEKQWTEIINRHKADEAKLPAKPDVTTPFREWIKQHHADVFETYCAIPRNHRLEREEHHQSSVRPLFWTWIETDSQGAEVTAQYEKWNAAKQAIDEAHSKAKEPVEQLLMQAQAKLEEIAEKERRAKREAALRERMRLEQEAREDALLDEMGLELWRELNPDHPDFDREAFELVCNLPGRNTESHFDYNFVLNGPTGTGKSRTMAYIARNAVQWTDAAWLTSARFSDLVTMLSGKRKDEARAELRRLAEVEFLFFDDLGAVHFTEPRIAHFYTLINARYAENLVTYFSTNYGRDGIEEMLAPSGDPEAIKIAKAIIRRMIGTPAEPRANLVEFKNRKAPAAKGRREKAVC